ncbi:hypothetical protein GUITHDRAFT_107625 [Guillardia theta CCMP2712]|uniref:Uncharacterized protein n=1 Tax=Guillardia theta (strain CCMP2712) TaxID=905079 RepID=L1JD15_GUITC|nr:hypothetical protein GUITHDRAFT_107625 [Guillardia theta CCMP2712]EKX46423.1 hypothetical protein GUITHDRAFT_107625 [Guillardia theta CCMP2712]|eukprot:XP_005833403.1 hypothetical protein GUITHDRAFT_107625 [Guillardia theta CCMP2712]
MPQRRSHDSTTSLVELYFFEELMRTCGRDEANNWLASNHSSRDSSRCASRMSCEESRPETPTSECSFHGSHDILRSRHSICEGEMSHKRMKEIVDELGSEAGLLFTDAAHTVLR